MYNVGDIVLSLQGRDKGRIFMVVGIIDDLYVLIVDGSLRKLENPKKKKIKHLKFFGNSEERIVQKINESKKITNAELRKMMKNISNSKEIFDNQK